MFSAAGRKQKCVHRNHVQYIMQNITMTYLEMIKHAITQATS